VIPVSPSVARLAAVALVLVLAGCSFWRAPEAEPEPAAPVPLAADDPVLTTLVESWANVVDERRSLGAGVVLKLSGPQGERRLSLDVVLARPARLRMEIQAFLTTAAVLVANGVEYDYFESLNRYRERGPIHPQLLWQIAGVPLTLPQAVDFLLGGLPLRRGLEPAGGVRESDGSVSVELHDAIGRRVRSLRFDPEGPLRQAEEWLPDGRLYWRVGYDRYRDVGEQPFAHTIEFDFPRYESRATVALRRVELNPETPDAVFELQIPDDGEAP
jgi:hypothetical protein